MGAFSRLRNFPRRHREDEKGAALVLTALSMVLLLGSGALGVDVGFSVFGSRTAQAMADTAALDLAQDMPAIDSQDSNPDVAAYITTLLQGVDTDNGSSTYLTATPGLWWNGSFSTLSGGCAGTVFNTPPAACNAIEVTANQTVPQPFRGGFNTLSGNNRGGSPLSSSQTGSYPPTGNPPSSGGTPTIAVYAPETAFNIGSYLATINTQQSSVLNALLSPLGTSASVTLVGYQGLANTYVSINQLINASGGLLTTSNVLTASLSGAQWLTILGNAVGNQVALLSCGSSPTPLPCNAQTALSALDFSSSTSAQLCQMISINGSTCGNATLSSSALNTSVDLLQMLSTEAELANGSSALNVKLALSLPNVTSASLSLNLIQPAQAAEGPVGTYTTASPCPAPSGSWSTCAVTAQVSADLKLTVLSLLGVSETIDIPLSAAVGYATLNSVTCSDQEFQNSTINVSTTVASGSVTLNGNNLTTLTINGVNNKAGTFSTIPPTASTVSAHTNPRNFGSTTPTLSWGTSLLGLGLDANVLTLLNSNLQSVLGPVLQAAGASVGGAQVADTWAKCDAVAIVQ
jgi:uncharacterized membrane protein